MKKKRKYDRFPLLLDARFSSTRDAGIENDGRIIDICSGRLAAMLRFDHKPNMSMDHHVTINIQNHFVNCIVRLQWLKELKVHQGYNFIAGCRFVSSKPEEKENMVELGRRHYYSTRQDHQHDSPAAYKKLLSVLLFL